MRKLASQIPESVSRLLQSGHRSTPPVWYGPVLSNPPPLLRPLREHSRPDLDPRAPKLQHQEVKKHQRGAKPMRTKRWSIRPVVFEEDDIRRQFFRDFPFEALRPTSLVEMRSVELENPVRGDGWTKLEQRGLYPTVEDTIEFTLQLRSTGLSISHAYAQATGEFVQLRAKHEMATLAAEVQARYYGAEFLSDPFERHHVLEGLQLDKHLEAANRQASQVAQKVRWKPLKSNRYWTSDVDNHALPNDDFTGGKSYIDKWRIQPEPEEIITSLAERRAREEAASAAGTSPAAAGEGKGEATSETVGAKAEEAEEEIDELEYLEKILGNKK